MSLVPRSKRVAKALTAWRQVVELAGFATVCVGISLVSIPAGLVATGLVLVLVANARA